MFKEPLKIPVKRFNGCTLRIEKLQHFNTSFLGNAGCASGILDLFPVFPN